MAWGGRVFVTWVKLDDNFAEHRKVTDLSDRAFRLHVAALCYCARNLTDGALTDRAVRVTSAIVNGNAKHVRELAKAGLWLDVDGGYEINGFLEYNPRSENARSVRDQRREAGRRGGRASAEAKREANASKQNAKQTLGRSLESVGGTNPVPSPRSEVKNTSDAGSSRKPDPLWDALVAEIGSTPSTASERGRWNKALKELRDAGATAEDITARAKTYRKRWPEVSLTPTALNANWGSLQPEKKGAPPCPECGIGGGRHLSSCLRARAIA